MYFCKVDHSRISRNIYRNQLGLNNLCEILWMDLGGFGQLLGGLSWVLDRFRPFLILLSTKGLNVGIDLMCSFLCKNLTILIPNLQKLLNEDFYTFRDVQPFLRAHVAGPIFYMSQNFKLPKYWASEVPLPSCPISNCPTFQTVNIYFFTTSTHLSAILVFNIFKSFPVTEF